MKYDEILARSFSQKDQKRLGFGALVACFLLTLCLCTVFKPYLGPLPLLNMRLTMVNGLKLMIVTDETIKPQRPYPEIEKRTLICDTSKRRTDTCELKGDVRIHANSSTIFVVSSHTSNSSWFIKPYARKGDESAMERVTKFTIKSVQQQQPDQTMPKCTKTHNVPGIVFSVGGYAGNNFHAFTDVIIPLYETSRDFDREVKFLVANKRSRWTNKFREVLNKLSKYEVIDIDNENEVHCFPSVIVGLKKEDKKELYIDSMKDFTKFLRSSYSLDRSTVINLTTGSTRKPRLLIVSRRKTRAFTNVADVVRAAQDSGFEVIVTEMNANMTQVSRLVNSVDVMMGVHGAGLTNMVFLPENGVVIQVVPWGKMEWLANTYFGEPSKGLGLKYLEYKISEGESTLIEQYPLDHQVFVDPFSIQRKGWGPYKSIYLDKQSVNLNVTRFKQTLFRALQLLYL